ncbi:MAG: TolC family protein [Thermoanaerobaculia bacterium]
MRRFLLLFAAALMPALAAAQPIDLGALQDAARSTDPRLQQLQLESEQLELRLANIVAERRPSLAVEGQAQYQSDVIQIPLRSPDGSPLSSPPKDTWDASIRLEQTILDPSLRARLAAERARLAEAIARVETALYAIRQEVNEAFFAAASLQEREAQIETAITDLEARLDETKIRVAEGAALPSDAATIEAVLLARRQDKLQLRAQREGALGRLEELTGRTITVADELALPDHSAATALALAEVGEVRSRPEYEQFARSRDRLAAQVDIVETRTEPRITAYGRAGYGKPGLNPLSTGFDTYLLAGIRLQWKPWDWGVAARERKQLELQRQTVESEEAAFERNLRKSVQNDIASIAKLTEVLDLDARIVELRELIERETRSRYEERAVTAAEMVDKTTDVLEARLLRAVHQVELAQARARLLTVLGLEAR